MDGGLKVEPLTAALFVVCGDPLGGPGADVVDAEQVAGHVGPGERVAAHVTGLAVLLVVAGAASRADGRRERDQATVGTAAGSQHRLVDPVCAPFVIDEAARTELGNGEEAGALQVAVARVVGASRNKGHQRETREVISGEKPFGREEAVDVKVGADVRRAAEQERDLSQRLGHTGLCRFPFVLGNRIVLEDAVGLVALRLGCDEQIAPALEGAIEGLGCVSCQPDSIGVDTIEPADRGEFGRKGVEHGSHSPGTGLCRFGRRDDAAGVLGQGAVRRRHVQVLGDVGVELEARRGKPLGVQVAVYEVLVGEIDGRGLDHARDHRRRVVEEVLIVGALRRAVGKDQGRLTAAPSAAAALHVICGRRRHVAQIDDVHR